MIGLVQVAESNESVVEEERMQVRIEGFDKAEE